MRVVDIGVFSIVVVIVSSVVFIIFAIVIVIVSPIVIIWVPVIDIVVVVAVVIAVAIGASAINIPWSVNAAFVTELAFIILFIVANLTPLIAIIIIHSATFFEIISSPPPFSGVAIYIGTTGIGVGVCAVRVSV